MDIAKVIEEKVRAELDSVLADDNWTKSIEQYVIKFAQERIAQKFAHSDYTPHLLKTVEDSVKELFDKDEITIKDLVTDETIDKAFQSAVDKVDVQAMVKQHIETAFNDNTLATQLAAVAKQAAYSKIEQYGVNNMVKEAVSSKMDKDFTSIQSTTSDVMLRINKDETVNEKLFFTKDLKVTDTLVTNDLVVKGRVNVDNKSWTELEDRITQRAATEVIDQAQDTIANKVIEFSKQDGIDFKNVKIDGSYLVQGQELSQSITKTSITEVGELDTLTVKGESSLSDTITIKTNGRVGINTTTPGSALEVWDDDVTLAMGKLSSKTGFVGMSRQGTLALGSNNTAHVTIDEQGVLNVSSIKIGHNSVSWARDLPGYSGIKGDIVYNLDCTNSADSPIGWQCLGAYRWRPILSQ
tara:strand:- start:763 stop:1995 length:1233 start_codon:yes stop_codon:yes gene_type:complete